MQFEPRCYGKGNGEGALRKELASVKRGENKATLNAIRNVMDSFKVSVDAAMDALHIPEADRAKL